jgi:hypothetical protein
VATATKNATLTAYSTDGKPVVRYVLEHPWPSKLEIGPINPTKLRETVTLVCESLQRIAP